MFFDPLYLIMVAPALLLAMWAQAKVRSAYDAASRVRPSSGLNGAETARRILQIHGIQNVSVEAIQSFLGDHYDPRDKVLRLSPDVYNGRSLAALGIAAHEVGHAIQDAKQYAPLVIRNGIVPLASMGSGFSFILIIAGIIIQSMHWLAVVGLALFGAVVLFQIINLPVEFDASRRARAILLNNGMITTDEDEVVGKVLNAAAMTYVAATLTALLQMLYFASIVFGRRS